MLGKPLTTLSIERSSLRFLTLGKKGVQEWGGLPATLGLVLDSGVSDAQALASAIDSLLAPSKASRNGVVVGLTGLGSASRVISLPRLKGKQMDEAVRWAARKELPLSLEQVHFSWQVVGNEAEEQKVFILGTPLSLLESVSQALGRARVKPRGIDLKPLALVRLVNRDEAVVIDVESDVLTIILIVGGVPEVIRTSVVGGEALSTRDRVERIARELGEAAAAVTRSSRGQPLSAAVPAFLTGGLAESPGLAELLGGRIDHPLQPPDVGVELPAEFPISEYAVNLGLVL